MELDKRIKEGKRPLTCFDLKEAEEYVGKKCYISNEYDFFRDLDFTQQKILNGVEDCETPFHYDSDKQAEFCLPCDWVKEPEKKYRPYSLEEFLEIFDVGDQIEFRYKDTDDVKHAMFTGYITDVKRIDDKTPGACEVMLGIFHYSLLDLFKDFERFYNGRWWPFGTEVKDEE